jgi:hypothetical protein
MIRVRTDDGLSNPWLLSVGQLAQVAEQEDNSTFESAQPIPAPAVVEGRAEGNDVDFFRFAGKKGQRIVLDAQCARIGSGVDPTIRLTTASRAYVASADDSPGLLTDARLTAVLPEDTDYIVELSDSRYQGGGRPVYRLVVGAVPMADEVFPIGGRRGETIGLELRGGTLGGARVAAATVSPATGSELALVRATDQALGLVSPGGPALDVESMPALVVGDYPELREPADPSAPPLRAAAPVVLNGRIDPAGDEDRFTLAVAPGQKLSIRVDAFEKGSALDGVLQVYGPTGASLATADDTNIPVPPAKAGGKPTNLISPDPSLEFTVPAGVSEITLALKDLESRGGVGFPYRIAIEPVVPGFELALNDAQVSIPKGGTAVVGVAVKRKGYDGPIALGLADAPAGMTVRAGTVAAGQAAGAITVSLAADAAIGAVHLDVVGKADAPGGPIVAHASKALVFAQQSGGPQNQRVTLPTNTVIQAGLFAAPATADPVRIDAPEAPVEVVHGFGGTVPIKAERAPEAAAELAIAAASAPTGLSAEGKLAEKAAEANVAIKSAVEAPLGRSTIVLTAKGKLGGSERTIAIPAVAIEVVRPASLELEAPTIDVKAGETVELKGKVVRKGDFKEPVTVKLTGLPAGLKAEPVTVAPDASEFAVAIVAEPNAPAATAKANAALAFQLNKKDYPTPASPVAVKVVPAK